MGINDSKLARHSKGIKEINGILPAKIEDKAGNQVIQKGWSYMQGDDYSREINKMISFDKKFKDIPYMTATSIGATITGEPISAKDLVLPVTLNISLSGIDEESFSIRISRVSINGEGTGVYGSIAYYGFAWIAIGTIR